MSFSISPRVWSVLNVANLCVRHSESSSLDQPCLVASGQRGGNTTAFRHMAT